MKVLIVEDNTDSRNLLTKQLSAYGHKVTAAVDGVDALEKAQKSPPDVLVSDILMPRMDGYKLCYEWKQNKQLKDIPFVFYTAIYTSGEDEKFALSLGANLFIRKPIEPEALAKILSQAFEQAKEGLLPPAKAPPEPSLYLTEYNERLVAKLNEKVAELEKSEGEIRYISSILGAIRNINQLIVRERDKTRLLKGACRILLKVREYRFVWIGLIEEGHKRVIPAARAGVEDKYLDAVEITWDDKPSGQGPTGTAIKTKKPDLLRNIPENPRAASWREEAVKRGYRSSAAIPIIRDKKVYGALNVYSSQSDGFNEAEVDLLIQVSGDLGFALNAIERQEARQQAEEALQESEAKYKTLTEDVPIGIYFNDFKGTFLYGNKKAAEITGYKREELLGKSFPKLKLLGPKDMGKALKLLALNRLGRATGPDQFELNRKDGTQSFVEIRTRITTVGGKKLVLGMVEDITERQQAEEALRESEAFQSGLLSNSPVPISVINADSSVRYVNSALEKLTGFSAEELIGEKAPYAYWLEEDQAKTMKGFEKAMRQGGKGVVELFKKKNGQRFWVEITATPVRKDGQFQYLLVSWVDITERKQAEEALRDSEEKYKGLAESITDIFFAFDKDLRYIYWNKASEELTGISAKDALGKHLLDIFPDSDMTRNAEKMYLKALRTQKVQSFVNEYQLGGKGHFFEINVYPSKDGLSVFVKDVTERKQADEALQQSNKRFADIADNALEWIWEVDASGKYTYASPVVEQILGYKPEEVIGKTFYDLFHPDDREELKKAAFAAFAEKQSFRQFVNRNIRKDGEIVWLSTSGVPILNERGNLLGYRGADVDITERVRAEEALRESEAFQSGLLSNSPVPITVVNPDGSLRYVSPALEKLTGYPAEELMWRKPPYPYWPKERHKEIMANFNKAMRQGGKGVVELYQKKNGEKFWVEITTTPVKKDGELQYILGSWVDITERKQAEEALRESEARYRAVIEGAHDMIQSVGLDGGIIFVNKAWRDTLGYTEADLASLNMFDIIHPKYRKRCREKMAEVAKGKPARNIETTFLTKDGREILVEGNAAPRYIGSRVVATQGIFRDVTERKRAEAKLADEATRRRILIDESSDGIVILEENGKVYEANRRFAEMLGYTPEEARELSVWDWEFQYPREQVAEMIRTVDETGDRFETRHRRKDGSVFDVEISTNGAVYAGQKLIFCVCRDITARKQAEAALRESEEKYKNLVGATSDIIWETDAEGRFTFISPKIKDILGYKVDEVVGKKRTLDFVPKGQFRKWLKRFKELNAKREPFFGLEIPHLHKNGRQVIFETSGIPLFDGEGKLMGYVGINRDITERRQMQEQLVITDRLASVGELAAGIAHELNNPLTGVIGFSQLLMDKEMPEDIKQDIKVVYSEAQRASQVVKNLLTFARKHAAAKEKVNINDIIKKVLELRAYEQNLENIKVDARLDPDLPETMVDYFQLQQVFLNIIINAEYFMKEAHHKGELTITTERVNNKVRASFADDGPGIAKENLGHLFDPFFTTKEVGKGTGLGLSICHGIVAEHGGRMYVESELGKGATFIVELPIGAAEKKGGVV
jgi:PAS domain S-box-containing protein